MTPAWRHAGQLDPRCGWSCPTTRLLAPSAAGTPLVHSSLHSYTHSNLLIFRHAVIPSICPNLCPNAGCLGDVLPASRGDVITLTCIVVAVRVKSASNLPPPNSVTCWFLLEYWNPSSLMLMSMSQALHNKATRFSCINMITSCPSTRLSISFVRALRLLASSTHGQRSSDGDEEQLAEHQSLLSSHSVLSEQQILRSPLG